MSLPDCGLRDEDRELGVTGFPLPYPPALASTRAGLWSSPVLKLLVPLW